VSPLRATIIRTFTIEYDVTDEYYDGSYSLDEIKRLESKRPLRSVVRQDDYDVIDETTEISTPRPLGNL
jgi:hypothetical protein